LGTNITTLALPLLVLALTHSPALAGLLAATRQLPYLLVSLPAGVLVDRWERKRTMIFCDLVRWLALGSVPLAFVLGHLTLIHLYLVATIEGVAYVFFSLAQISALPHVVDPEQLPRAYALDTTTENLALLLGPSLSAFIISLAPAIQPGAMLAYLTDSSSYLVSLFSLWRVRVSFQKGHTQSSGKPHFYGELVEGLRFLWQQRTLRLMALLTTLVNFLQSPFDLVLVVLAQNRLHLNVQFIGLILSAGGVGGILGSILAPWLRERLRCGQILLISLIVWSSATLLLAIAPWPPLLLAGKFLLSFVWPSYGVAVVSYRLQHTPDELQGRVNSAFRTFTYGSEPLGSALGGLLLVVLSAQTVFGLIAAGLFICLLIGFWSGLRRV
jgi:MFS family permease